VKHPAALNAVTVSGLLAMMVLLLGSAQAADQPTPADYTKISPPDLVSKTPKGKLHNPYKDTQKNIVAQGQTLPLQRLPRGRRWRWHVPALDHERLDIRRRR
jgi:hypothetical protein